MTPHADPLRDLGGFRVGDVVVCPSGKLATITGLWFAEMKLHAEYVGVAEHLCHVVLDPAIVRRATQAERVRCG